MKANYESKLAEKEAVIKELKNELRHLHAIAGHDGTNTGIPTSQTPIRKEKVIPNSRKATGKKRGGQVGHKQHVLESFAADEITECETHEITTEVCERCEGTDFSDTGERIFKDEHDVKVTVVKRRHEYIVYGCLTCGTFIHVPIENRLKEQNQYGSTVQAIAVSLMNTGNVPINKVRTILSGLTQGSLVLSEGYIAKLQCRAAKALQSFLAELRGTLVQRRLIYWDDTVIKINTARACLRFYGDEQIAYYTAHLHKDKKGLDKDHVLQCLTEDTIVMHDHNKVNYNDDYCFQNIECNQHLQRDCQKNSDDSGHTWSTDLKTLVSETIKSRKDAIENKKEEFTDRQKKKFYKRLDKILKKADKENSSDPNRYYTDNEAALIRRICRYQDNYFAWVENFGLPTTDNLSERGLRCVKSHMKISGQFISEETAGFYAAIKTYVETCRRNGINEIAALIRLSEGKPYRVAEILG